MKSTDVLTDVFLLFLAPDSTQSLEIFHVEFMASLLLIILPTQKSFLASNVTRKLLALEFTILGQSKEEKAGEK